MNKELIDLIIKYETEGFDTDQQYIDFFQELIDTGHAWTLQGRYGRTAKALIEAGYCEAK